jgi:hypothetical protein
VFLTVGQQAEWALNELASTQAEVAKKIAKAEGEMKSLVTRAQGKEKRTPIGRQNSLNTQLSEFYGALKAIGR